LIDASSAWVVNFNNGNDNWNDKSNKTYALCVRGEQGEQCIYFLTSSPKLREVFASDFRDRVVHHLLVKDLNEIFEATFIYDSYSCREKKGIHLATHRLGKFVRNKEYSWYLQLDIKSFFLHINKNILFEKIREVTKQRRPDKLQRVLYLSRMIIYDDPTEKYIRKGDAKEFRQLDIHKSLFGVGKNRGLPIGNLTSQFFANIYMNDLDNFIKRRLKVKYYMRYVDDMVLLGKSKEELTLMNKEIENYLRDKLNLTLRQRYFLRPCKSGIDFLGYVTKPTHTLVRQRVVNNFKYKKARFLDSAFIDGYCNKEDAQKFKEINASFYGHIKHADRQRLGNKYQVENWLKNK
jgi:retron-type reverse transcriptase